MVFPLRKHGHFYKTFGQLTIIKKQESFLDGQHPTVKKKISSKQQTCSQMHFLSHTRFLGSEGGS